MEKISSRREDKKEQLSDNTVKNKLFWKNASKDTKKYRKRRNANLRTIKRRRKPKYIHH
jgi:hypothetical protein